jgi:regulatory protein
MKNEDGKIYERRTKTPEQALVALMRLAARAEKSSGDVTRLLHTWGVDHAAHNDILSTLVNHRFIDDRRYAEAYVREKSRINGWGVYKIRQMLASKGIDRRVADDAMSQIETVESSKKLHEMLARKVRITKEIDTYKLKGKLLRYGLSLGYGYDVVAEVVEKIISD